MQKPYEIVAQPFEVWLAPVGTTFPKVDTTPTSPWAKIGTSGNLNYDESGVVVTHEQKVDVWRALGSTGARKAFRTEESETISFKLADLTLEQLAHALNENSITTHNAGTGDPGYKKIGLSRGNEVVQKALLVRGTSASAYGVGNAQYEVPVAVQIGKPKVTYVKGKPALIDFEFEALEDPTASTNDERFGRLLIQTANATT